MTDIAPEAVEAVARVLATPAPKRYLSTQPTNEQHHAGVILAFIRDAIHRDGDDADAIRQALGLKWGDPFSSKHRRVVGEWQVRP